MVFKDREKKVIKQLVVDCDLYGLTEVDSLEYIRIRLGKSISRSYYYRIKNLVNSDPSIDKWFNHFCKVGYLAAHKRCIEEMEVLQNNTKQLLFKELNNDDKHVDNILKLLERIESQNKRLEELYTAGPVLSNVRKIIQQNRNEFQSLAES